MCPKGGEEELEEGKEKGEEKEEEEREELLKCQSLERDRGSRLCGKSDPGPGRGSALQ